MLRLIARGVSPDLDRAGEGRACQRRHPAAEGGVLLFLIPMFAILSPLLGGMTVAIDATAGERERGSLEPLLITRCTREALVTGKWLAAWTMARAVVDADARRVSSLTAHFYAHRKIAALMQFGLPELLPFRADRAFPSPRSRARCRCSFPPMAAPTAKRRPT